ncbi:hypothetical protein QSJ19_03010 [Gordonia sp. ABSL11-1]|uniref:hypothetical protein n=1 Tax=Gordonia sp. ABSL11-1 TaxID=3053924 RepID=UPI002573D352|nr:hypothetical protein [Gordonia sp. ABSL11-1]MDL9944569.1 hypothetical protein [Gordonia sp. ABSL11-1]
MTRRRASQTGTPLRPRTPDPTGSDARQAEWWNERHELVAFALRWAPFGGGNAEDILVTFGLAEEAYFRRLRVILDGPTMAGLDATVWERLRQVCTHPTVCET